MARYVENLITLTAGQAAGTSPILAADTGGAGLTNRSMVLIGNPTAKTFSLYLNSGGPAAGGIPLGPSQSIRFNKNDPGLDSAIYCTGGATNDLLSIWVA